MALKTSISESTPDRAESKLDTEVAYRGYWTEATAGVFNFVKLGYFKRKQVHTIKKWYACTLEAYSTFRVAYTGDGAIDCDCTSDVLKSYNVTLTETDYSEEWFDYEAEA